MNEDEAREKARWQRILRTYGITKADYEKLDPGHCRLCLRPWSPTVRPAVDHDHVSGYVRGILCLYCNRRVLGRLRDHLLVGRMAAYLAGPFDHVVPTKKKKKRIRKKIVK